LDADVVPTTSVTHSVPFDDIDEQIQRKRSFKQGSFWRTLIRSAGIALSLFHFLTAGFGTLPMMKQANVHLGIILF